MCPRGGQLSLVAGAPTVDSTSLRPVAIPLKSELAYEVFEKGQVRFWLQAEQLSPDASFRFVINDREVADSEVSCPGRGTRLLGPGSRSRRSALSELQTLGCMSGADSADGGV